MSENRLTAPSLVTDAEVEWYLDRAILLVSEVEAGLQVFVCANSQTRYVAWKGDAVFRLLR